MQYIAIVVLSSLLSPLRQPGKYWVAALTCAYVLFAFFTKEGSWDYGGYADYYFCATTESCGALAFELSFAYASKLFDLIFEDFGFELVILIYIALSLSLKLHLLRVNSAWFGVAVFAFVCHSYFMHELTQLRAALAIAISWYAYSAYAEKRYIHAAALLAAATFVHVSAALSCIPLLVPMLSRAVWTALVIGAAVLGNFLAEGSVTIPLVSFERLNTYLNALGSELLLASQFNFFVITMLITAGGTLWLHGAKLTAVERIHLKAMLLGIVIYLGSFFIPIVAVRVLEYLTSVYPFIVARWFRETSSKSIRAAIILVYLALFANTAIRNNVRLDLVFPWHTITDEMMTDVQFEQFIRYNSK